MHYEIHANKMFQNKIAYSLDSSYDINQINPEGIIKLKVPVSLADTFIQSMLSMDAGIDHLLIDEEDITASVNEIKESLESTPVKSAVPIKLKQQIHDEQKVMEKIREKSDLSTLTYRTQYLWFDIYLHGTSYIEKEPVVSEHQLHEPFYVNGLQALEAGWYRFSWMLIAVLHIWPFMIICLLGFLFFKKKKWALDFFKQNEKA
jgi:hypothetical protein